MRPVLALACVLAVGCGYPDDDQVFGFIGEVADFSENGSTIGLFHVTDVDPPYLYKLGDGSSVVNMFDIAFDKEPPAAARETSGIGVATIGMLPGLATIPEGDVDSIQLRLVGHSDNHAIIFKAPGATGPAWTQRFPDGFSCGRCVKVSGAPDEFEPEDCSFVVVERFFGVDPCAWF